MKFIDLTGPQRSMLTMLCTAQRFNTEELGRGCTPKLKPAQAANSLLALRDLGLVYSSQKAACESYATWGASQYGKAVFEGRPAEVPAVQPAAPAAGSAPTYTYVVYSPRNIIGHSNWQAQHSTEDAALAHAAELAEKSGEEFYVAKLMARVRPVTKPTHEIERV